jgi:hypothetical protein
MDAFTAAAISVDCGPRKVHMRAEGKGTGKLVSTGNSEPQIDVKFDISHKSVESCSVPEVNEITSLSGEKLPFGDVDLLAGTEILRLRHCDHGPEWLVLSTD